MTDFLNGSKPCSALCRKVSCPDLKIYTFDTVNGPGKKSYYCGITSRIPGNMSKCSREVSDVS